MRTFLPGQLTVFAAAVMLLAALDAPGELFTHLTAEDGVVDYDLKTNPASGWYAEAGSDYRFKLAFKQGERDTTNPVLVATIKTTSAEHYRGKSALQIEIIARNESARSAKAAYKAAVDISGGPDTFAPPVFKPADWYHGFAMKIDPGYYQLPETGEVLFEQWWQGSPFHPPVSLVIVNQKDALAKGWADAGTNGNFALILRDDEHNADNPFPGQPQFYDLGPAILGQWMRWVVEVRPSAVEPDGAVTITLDGRQKLKLEHIKVGYNPRNPQYAAHKPSDHIAAVDIALYRLNGRNFQRFYFDEVRFADSFADASP